MTTTIGRASFSYGPSSVSWSGDTVSLDIPIRPPTTIEQAKVIRQQLLGMMNNPDESAFPVTSTEDSDLDGFYTVRGVNVEPVDSFLRNGVMFCSLGLVRVANGYQNPTIETTVVSRLATNAHGVLSTTDFALAASYSSNDTFQTDFTGMLSLIVLPGEQKANEDGVSTTYMIPFSDTNVSGYWSRYGNPETYYSVPSCKIEYKVGSTWYAAVGRQIPPNVPWRLSNTGVRIGADVFPPSTTGAFIEYLDNDTLTWVGRYINGRNHTSGTDIYIGGFAGPFILRNSPDVVSVAVQATDDKFATYTLWRGSSIAIVELRAGSAIQLGLKLVSTVAGTNVTGGIEMSSADANGNKLRFLCRSAVTTDTATTGIRITSAATSAVFSVGFDNGSAGTSFRSAGGMLGALCTPPQWRSRIAAR